MNSKYLRKKFFMAMGTVVKSSFLFGLATVLIAAWLKMMHSPVAKPFLVISLVLMVVYIAFAIYEVRTSPKISTAEKAAWTLAFMFFSGITAAIYFFFCRNRIAGNPQG